jgi:cold-inducible RNA-binding protein
MKSDILQGDAFAQHGTVEAVSIFTDRETGRSKGFGFVTMTDGADKAIAQLSDSELKPANADGQ